MGYAGDNNTCETVAGYIILINGVVVEWNYKSQKIITILSQNLNIQQSQGYVDKYYLSLKF